VHIIKIKAAFLQAQSFLRISIGQKIYNHKSDGKNPSFSLTLFEKKRGRSSRIAENHNSISL